MVQTIIVSGPLSGGQITLYDVAVHQLAYQGTWWLNDEIMTERTPRSAHPSTTPVQLFKSSDGYIYIACMSDKFWELLCELLELSWLVRKPGFSTLDERLASRDELTRLLDDVLGCHPTAYWVDRLGDLLPVAPVYNFVEALESPFFRDESEMLQQVAHSSGREISVFANPIRLNGERVPQQAAPPLGRDTDQLTRRLRNKAISRLPE